MSNILNVAAVQLDIEDGNKAVNIHNAQRQIEALSADTDLVVLPEMFSTGFITDSATVTAIAETEDGYTLTKLKEMACRNDLAIVTSIIISEGDRLYNRMFFVDNTGAVLATYDKHHLFDMSPEAATFTSGTNLPPTVEYRGFCISMTVCYDLRFPVWMRNIPGPRQYDIMIVTASWPDAREYAWTHLLIARAIENQAYVVGCNRTGQDRWGTYSGTSAIVSPKGKILNTATGHIVTATLDLQDLINFRHKFPVYLHGDKFTYSL